MLQKLCKMVNLGFVKPSGGLEPANSVSDDELFDDVYGDESIDSDSFIPSDKTKDTGKNSKAQDPELRASDIYEYTGGKVKLYVKDASGNFVEWTPDIDGDQVLNNYTEAEIAEGLFNGTLKFTYTETGAEIDLNTIRDILNGKIKPEDIKAPNNTNPSEPAIPPANEETPPIEDGQVRPQSELEYILTKLAKGLDKSQTGDDFKPNGPDTVIEEFELYQNIGKMLDSNNPEIAGIAQIIVDLYESMGIDNWQEVRKNNPGLKLLLDDTSDYAIVTGAIFAAIKGEEIDPEIDYGFSTVIDPYETRGLTVDDLMALDKNGDGSIVDELKELLTDPEFIDTVKFMLQRQENYRQNTELINEIAGDDGIITEEEIEAQFGKNAIADLFRRDDGTLDLDLLIVFGAKKDKDGNFTISAGGLSSIFNAGIVNSWIDTDRDGIITKEEIEAFKETEYYNKQLEWYMRYGQ